LAHTFVDPGDLCDLGDLAVQLLHSKDISKTNQVVHWANIDNPSHSLVCLYKKYNFLCPQICPADSFYLSPLAKPTKHCWYKASTAHCKLAGVVPRLMKSAGNEGYFTIHSMSYQNRALLCGWVQEDNERLRTFINSQEAED